MWCWFCPWCHSTRRAPPLCKAPRGGTTFRQHNEPVGDQEVLHFHLHLFPRYFGDDLYRKTDEHRFAAAEERAVYAQKLRSFLDTMPD